MCFSNGKVGHSLCLFGDWAQMFLLFSKAMSLENFDQRKRKDSVCSAHTVDLWRFVLLRSWPFDG